MSKRDTHKKTSWRHIELPHEIILASASPRRAAILRQIGLRFTQKVSNIRETGSGALAPADLTQRLACRKAREIVKTHKKAVVIGCDTMVIYKGKIFGKPKDKEQALAMLTKLNGRYHEVCSGVAVKLPGRNIAAASEITKVYFHTMSRRELQWYVNTGESMDKAGAYGIQGKGAMLVKKIEGCYYNVVGFPLNKFLNIMDSLYGAA